MTLTLLPWLSSVVTRFVTAVPVLFMTGMLVRWPPLTLVGLTLVRTIPVLGVNELSPLAMWLLNWAFSVTSKLSPRSVLIVGMALRTLGTLRPRGRSLGNVLWVTSAAIIGTFASLVSASNLREVFDCMTLLLMHSIGCPVPMTTPVVLPTRPLRGVAAGWQLGRLTVLGYLKAARVVRVLPSTLIRIGFGCLAFVRRNVLVTMCGTLVGLAMRQPRPITGTATLETLVLRKVLALTVVSGIRLATVMTGIELTQVLVTGAMRPAVLGLEAVT